jgi:hypothetical protein
VRVIGLSGFAGAGKTAAAKYIEERYGFERKHIAEPLRAMLAVLLRINGISDEMITRYLEGDLKDGVVIPEIGKTSRDLQITLGTEWGREQVHPALWSDTWKRSAGDGKVMNDSVRFPNEQDAIREMGGVTILIDRPGSQPAKFKWGQIGKALFRWFGLWWGIHDSERLDRLRPDFVIHNDGTLEDLYEAIDQVIAWAGTAAPRRASRDDAVNAFALSAITLAETGR